MGDCLEFEDDFYMATCHKYIVPAFAHHCAHDSIAHASISKDVLYVGVALRSMRLTCTSVERDTRARG